ncbi:hypothetical protein G4B88_008228 [Cannabis sativa]|uniref:Uncharacterized protein n=1 Tax=Cannabis sativa TaxID=3483 RepID=A0A7J6FLC1_CANSA|nr:hypothetical protein G4B88_008228 [Cannabis sativa]
MISNSFKAERIAIFSGNHFNLRQLAIRNELSLGAISPSFGKDTKLPQLRIDKDVSSSRDFPSDTEIASNFVGFHSIVFNTTKEVLSIINNIQKIVQPLLHSRVFDSLVFHLKANCSKSVEGPLTLAVGHFTTSAHKALVFLAFASPFTVEKSSNFVSGFLFSNLPRLSPNSFHPQVSFSSEKTLCIPKCFHEAAVSVIPEHPLKSNSRLSSFLLNLIHNIHNPIRGTNGDCNLKTCTSSSLANSHRSTILRQC